MSRRPLVMALKTFAWMAGALLAPTALAAQASWLLKGTLTEVEGTALSQPDFPGVVQVGASFSVILNFDTSTPVSNPVACGTGSVGTRCLHHGSTQQGYANLVVGGQPLVAIFGADPADNNAIIVRNNLAFPTPNDPVIDNLTFSTTEVFDTPDGKHGQIFTTIFRGPEDLNVVTDGRTLPLLPPAGLMSLGTRSFQVCEDKLDADGFLTSCNALLVVARIDAVQAVPEPGTWALFALGLGGLVLTRRRARA